MRWARIPLGAAILLSLGPAAWATPPPVPYCEVNRRQCHPMDGDRSAHYRGMLRQAIRAVPKVPGYRCSVERIVIPDLGYGPSEQRATPVKVIANLWCFHPGLPPAKRKPEAADVTIYIEQSTIPAATGDGGTRDKEHDLLLFAEQKRVFFVFGKVYWSRDKSGVFHRSCFAGARPEEEYLNDGPYLLSTQVMVSSETPAALDAFARGLDRAAIATLMTREAERRRADPGSKPIWGIQEPTPP